MQLYSKCNFVITHTHSIITFNVSKPATQSFFFLLFVFDHCPGFLTTIPFSPLLSFHPQLLQVSTSWSTRVLPWTCPAPTRPSTLPTRTPPEVACRPRSNPRPRPTPRRSRSSPVSLPSSSPGSCLGRGCPSPSTWSPLCPAPSRCAPTALCPSTELVWKTGMWFCESWKVEGEGEKNNQQVNQTPMGVASVTSRFRPFFPQTLPMPQRGTTSWASPPSWPSWDRIPSCRSSSAWYRFGLPWLQWWRRWRTETCSASCGDAEM